MDIPDLSDLRKLSLYFTTRRIFFASGPENSSQYTLVSNYIRLVDLAISEYQEGRERVFSYWQHNGSLVLGAMISATGYFESCLSNIQRALYLLEKIRRHRNLPSDLKDKIPKGLKTFRGRTNNDIRQMRNIIQHFRKKDKGVDQPSLEESLTLSLKLYSDRLVLGDNLITYQVLSEGLKELHQYANNIHSYYLKNNNSNDSAC